MKGACFRSPVGTGFGIHSFLAMLLNASVDGRRFDILRVADEFLNSISMEFPREQKAPPKKSRPLPLSGGTFPARPALAAPAVATSGAAFRTSSAAPAIPEGMAEVGERGPRVPLNTRTCFCLPPPSFALRADEGGRGPQPEQGNMLLSQKNASGGRTPPPLNIFRPFWSKG